MAKFEHRVLQVMALWDAGDYYLAARVRESDDWVNVNRLGEQGWEFVSFMPNPEAYLRGRISQEQLRVIQLAIFKRRAEQTAEGKPADDS